MITTADQNSYIQDWSRDDNLHYKSHLKQQANLHILSNRTNSKKSRTFQMNGVHIISLFTISQEND